LNNHNWLDFGQYDEDVYKHIKLLFSNFQATLSIWWLFGLPVNKRVVIYFLNPSTPVQET